MKRYNISITQWNDYNQTLIFKNSDDTFVNLTWSVVKLTARRKIWSDIAIQKTLTVVDAIQWNLKISLSDTETSALSWTYIYDCEMIDATWIVSTIFWWKIYILSDIS